MTEREASPVARLIAVYDSEVDVRAAAVALQRAGVDPHQLAVERPEDHLASVGSEMRQELDETMVGPGSVGPFTRDMSRGMLVGTFIGAAIGLIIALPFAAISFGGWPVWLRLLVVALVGVAVGGTAGWVIGGGFGAERSEEQLAAEGGITLAVPATDFARQVLSTTRPRRVDLVSSEGRPIRVVLAHDEPIARTLGRHAAGEARQE